MRIALVNATDDTDVRAVKTLTSLSKIGHDVHFIGWTRRSKEVPRTELPGVKLHIWRSETRLGHFSLVAQLWFTAHVVRTLALVRPDVVCAANEDNTLRVLPFRHILFRRLVCDIYDSHALRFSEAGWWKRSFIRAACHLSQRLADRLLVTDDARKNLLGRLSVKAEVIENCPKDPGDSLSKTTPYGITKVFVSGALSRYRGLDTVLEAVKACPHISIVTAGWPCDEYAEQVFLRNKVVDYRGHVTPQQALEIAATCDGIFAFYEPNSANHRYASPNKLYDALSIGRPVIINSEVHASSWVVQQDVGFSCGYRDAAGLAAIFLQLASYRVSLQESAARARRLFLQEHSWEIMERRLQQIYQEFQLATAPRVPK